MIRRVSIVVPTLDEEDVLPDLLGSLRRQEGIEAEIVVADGGSTDRTVEIARRAGARVAIAGRGRGCQMNVGAREASHDLLLFLHADSLIDDPRLLVDGIDALEGQPSPRTAGHFALRFVPTESSLAFHHYEQKTTLNRRDVFGGDQGLLIRRAFFDELGGFDETLHFLEDKRIARKILDRGRMVTLPGRLGTSTRRFEAEGFARRMLLAAVIMGLEDIEFRPFFERVGSIYREQSATRRLDVAHVFSEIHRLAADESLAAYCRGWLGIGRYVRRNAWQLFFLGDSCSSYLFGTSRRPFLALHDRIVFPLTDFTLFSGLTAVAVWVGFHLTWLYYRLKDRSVTSRPTSATPD